MAKETKNMLVKKKKDKKAERKKTDNFKSVLFNKKHSLFDLLFFVIIVAIASILLTSQYVVHRYKSRGVLCGSNISKNKELNEFSAVYQEVIDNYYEEVDKKKLVEAGISGMLNYLEDVYSIHMNNDQSDSFDDNLEGSYQGIGIMLIENEILEVYDNSPAEKAGLKKGDLVKKIGDTEITKDNAYEEVQKIKDNLGNKLKITVERDGKIIEKELDVKKINLPIVTSNYVNINAKTIGYIKISSFTNNSYEQFSEQLTKLEQDNKIDSLVIDVRNNGGGYLEQAADIASLFVEKGKVIYSLQDKKGTKDIKDSTKEHRKYSIVVLVNNSTASSSEVLTASLKDNNNALIVGEKTYGKGKVQSTKKLDDGTTLKYTSSKWLRPNGECIDEKGLIPDYEIEQKNEKDSQYEKAISLLK